MVSVKTNMSLFFNKNKFCRHNKIYTQLWMRTPFFQMRENVTKWIHNWRYHAVKTDVCLSVSGYWHTIAATHLVRWGKATSTLVCTWMGDRCGMSISADSPSDETLNRCPLALLLRRQYEFPFGIRIVQFSIFNFFSIFQFSINS